MKTQEVYQAEALLAEANSKTVDVAEFQRFISVFCYVSPVLSYCYRNMKFRKWRFQSYIKTQRSEANMLNRFKKTFGANCGVVN